LSTRHRLCRVEEIPEGGKRIFPIGRFGVGLFNCKGRIVALNNYCPHAGARVCEGWITGVVELREHDELEWAREGEILRCPWHGWEFEIESGRTVTDPVRRIKRYDVMIEEGWVYVDV
jgi:nitrite reductase (NADH) small subunit